jgi:hypothetical protein
MTANHSYSISQVGWVPRLKGCELVVKAQDTYLNVEHIFIWGGCGLVVGLLAGDTVIPGFLKVVSVIISYICTASTEGKSDSSTPWHRNCQ